MSANALNIKDLMKDAQEALLLINGQLLQTGQDNAAKLFYHMFVDGFLIWSRTHENELLAAQYALPALEDTRQGERIVPTMASVEKHLAATQVLKQELDTAHRTEMLRLSTRLHMKRPFCQVAHRGVYAMKVPKLNGPSDSDAQTERVHQTTPVEDDEDEEIRPNTTLPEGALKMKPKIPNPNSY